MDNYLSVSKSITSQSTGRRNQGPGGKVEKGKHRQLYKHNPYNARPKDEQRLIDSNDGQLTAK